MVGRRAERVAVEQLLAQAYGGRSGVLVVRGQPGIGKTTLLAHARDSGTASGFRVESSCGMESETQFAFAGLHQLCAPLLDHVGELPEPQQAALDGAFGRRDGVAPDRFLVGLAVLTLLAEVAEERPLLCIVDDTQWMDVASLQILAFVARRLEAERMAMLYAVREPAPGDSPSFAGLPELRLEGLNDAEVRAVLTNAVLVPLDDQVRDRIVAEARGNPLAVLELSLSSAPAALAGGFDVAEVADLPRRLEDSFGLRSSRLPAETQLLLLIAAAEPTGDTALLWRAAERLGIDRDWVAPAEEAGLVEFDSRVRFRHPLVRSAVYGAATPVDRRRAHGALAAVTDPALDPDRRAWHRAHSVLGSDEEVAAGLERSAGRARARGGSAASAAFLQRATELTPDPARRSTRALRAAHAKYDAGALDAAEALLAMAASGPGDELQQARIDLLRAQIAFRSTRRNDVPWMLLDVAARVAPLDSSLSREVYLHAFDAAIIIGGVGQGRQGLREVAEAARAAPAPRGQPNPADLLLDGLVTRYADGYAAGIPGLRQALEAFCADDLTAAKNRGSSTHVWHWLASRTALTVFDDELLIEIARGSVRLAREAGDLARLPASLVILSAVSALSGDLVRASELVAEQTAITQATGGVPLHFGRLVHAAWSGRETETLEIHAASVGEAVSRGNGAEVALAQVPLAVLHNGLGNYAAALDAARQASRSLEPPHTNLALPELVEAAARAGKPADAAAGLAELEARADASRTTWALGMAATCRALISSGPAAEDCYRAGIERLRTCRFVPYLARAHLVYGEWLRREGRRQDARQQLRTAHDLLVDMGAGAFADRAARELRATGEHPRKRTARPTDDLTAQELHIAKLVATGATSREVGARLYLSPRTIEAHLRSVFRKLNITSRRQLRDMPLP